MCFSLNHKTFVSILFNKPEQPFQLHFEPITPIFATANKQKPETSHTDSNYITCSVNVKHHFNVLLHSRTTLNNYYTRLEIQRGELSVTSTIREPTNFKPFYCCIFYSSKFTVGSNKKHTVSGVARLLFINWVVDMSEGAFCCRVPTFRGTKGCLFV